MKNISRDLKDFRWFETYNTRDLAHGESSCLRGAVSRAKDCKSTMAEYALFRSNPILQWVHAVEDEIKMMQHEAVKTVCLCGSSKFRHEFHEAALRETLAGNVVLSQDFFNQKQAKKLSLSDRRLLVDVHLRKIEMADEILVVNVDFYIGDATQAEIAHAKSLGKTVRYVAEIT